MAWDYNWGCQRQGRGEILIDVVNRREQFTATRFAGRRYFEFDLRQGDINLWLSHDNELRRSGLKPVPTDFSDMAIYVAERFPQISYELRAHADDSEAWRIQSAVCSDFTLLFNTAMVRQLLGERECVPLMQQLIKTVEPVYEFGRLRQ